MLTVTVFSAQQYDKDYLLDAAQGSNVQFRFLSARLSADTVALAANSDAICVFVNDELDAAVLDGLKNQGVRMIALRCAGYNNLDLKHAQQIGMPVARVPAYSPEAVAEHTVALILSLNRKMHKAYNRTRDNDFRLDGLLGFTLHGKTVGLVGTGKIGQAVARILSGFGCSVLCHDPHPCDDLIKLGCQYLALEDILPVADIMTLHCPLTQQSFHLMNDERLAMMKPGAMLINTSRGGLLDTQAVIRALKRRTLGYLGLDVYEMESELFFADHSFDILDDDLFQRLTTFPNVLITGHQGFFTHEAMLQITQTTMQNLQVGCEGNTDPQTFLSP